MKKFIAILTAISMIGVSFFYAGGKLAVANDKQDLLTIVTVLKGENININEWSLQAREKMETNRLEDVQNYVQHLQNILPDWNWSISSDDEKWQANASFESIQDIEESIQIISTLNIHNPQTYIIYEAKGKNFTGETEHFIKEDITGTLSDIFRGNTTIFSCIKGEFNDKMNTYLPNTVNRLLDVFQAKEVESTKEDLFISTSAYSPLLADGITTNNHEMNLQLGIRTDGLGANTTLVVGTPIITIEY